MFKIIEVDNDILVCLRQGRYRHTFSEFPLNMSQIGVYRKGPLSNDIVRFHKNEIDGKVIEVDNLLITCTNNILREKNPNSVYCFILDQSYNQLSHLDVKPDLAARYLAAGVLANLSDIVSSYFKCELHIYSIILPKFSKTIKKKT